MIIFAISNELLIGIYAIAGIAVLIGAFFICKKLVKKYSWFKHILENLVEEAEEYFVGTKRGQEKLEYVMQKINAYIPAILKPYLTEQRIKKIIAIIVEKAKEDLFKN